MSPKPEHIIRVEDLGPLVQPKQILLNNAETELVDLCRSGERLAQKRVYELFAPKMLNVCRRYAKNKEQAKDFMHDAFIKVFLNLSKFRSEASLETWITRIMINHSISAIKKELRKGFKVELNEKSVGITEDVDFDHLEAKSIKAKDVFEVIEELPLGYKTVLSLYILDGYTHREISEELGISEGTSKSQLAKAKKKLADKLKERFL